MTTVNDKTLPCPELLTPLEVSATLNIPLGTLAGWRHSKKGPKYIKLGRLVRYRSTDITDFIASETEDIQHA